MIKNYALATVAATGLADGSYKVYSVDDAGNLSAASAETITIDSTAPIVTSGDPVRRISHPSSAARVATGSRSVDTATLHPPHRCVLGRSTRRRPRSLARRSS